MARKWIQILVILVFYQQITSEAVQEKTVKEGERVDVYCHTSGGTMVIWFRVLSLSRMEFIGSFSPGGTQKSVMTNYNSIFQHETTTKKEYILRLKSFKRSDSGIYSCASLVKGNELEFGEITRLVGEKNKEPTRELSPFTTKRTPTTTSCACKDRSKPAPAGLSLFCAPIILGPLVGGCGFLLLLLVIISSYCNYIRTRRCPHHHKRKPRMVVTDKLPMTNRHI